MEFANETLEGFGGWSDMTSETDFFNQVQEEDSTDASAVIKEITKDENEEVIVEGGDNNEQPTGDLFNQPENQDIEEEEEEKEKMIESPNIFVLNKLKEEGLIDYKLEEGEELTDELAADLIVDKFDESVENKVKELMGDLDDDSKQVIQFLVKGGNISEFISSVTQNSESINLDTDLEKEDNQISVMKKLLKLEDKDDEEIETEIEFLKDSGKLKAMTEKKFGKYKENIESQKSQILQEQEERIQAEKKMIKEAKSKISSFLSQNEEIDGIKFSIEDKKVLPTYMNDKSVKLNNGTFITQMQRELFYELPKNEKAIIQLATLLRNRNEDGTFNFESIVKSAKTKVTQEVRQNVRRDKSSIPGNSTTRNKESGKSLSDYFV